MTISTLSITDGPYAGNGVAASFAYNFKIDENTEIAVYETNNLGVTTLLTLTTHYTVSGVGNPAGGNVTRIAGALPVGYTWNIRANYVPTQLTAFASQGGFFPDVHEYAFDKLSYLVQQHADLLGRSLSLKVYDVQGDMTLPMTADRLGTVLAFDEVTGLPVPGPDIAQMSTVTAAVANIATVAGSIANVNTVAGSIANVNAVAGDIANVDIVGANIADVNTCATNIAAIIAAPTEAANAAASAAAALVSENNAAASEAAALAAVTGDIGAAIDVAPAKATPVDADKLGFFDSVGAALASMTFANLWTWIQSKLASVGVSVPTVNGVQPLHKNDIINGQFRIAQVGTSFIAPASSAYDLDGWFQINSPTVQYTVAQLTGSTAAKLARWVTVTTADAVVAAADVTGQGTRIEGYDACKYVGNTFTIGFRVRSSVTGVHCLAIHNGTSTYVAEYTINAANTWEYKTITVTGGVPVLNSYTNTWGLQLRWTNLCGTDRHTTAGAWNAGNFYSTVNQVNDLGTVGNVFALEDVTLNLGTVVAVDESTYADDLRRCMRYCQVMPSVYHAAAKSGAALIDTMNHGVPYPVPMRATPTWVNAPTAWVTAAPTAGQVRFRSYTDGAFLTITGALTVALTSAAEGFFPYVNAATSFSGTLGASGYFGFGEAPILTARL